MIEEVEEEPAEPEVVEPVAVEPEPEPEPVVAPEPPVVQIQPPPVPKPKPKPKPRIEYVAPLVSEVVEEEPTYIDDPEPEIGWAWFEREPIDRLEDVEDALASIANDAFEDGSDERSSEVPDDVMDRPSSWWNGG